MVVLPVLGSWAPGTLNRVNVIIVSPRVRVEGGVLDVPHRCACKPVGSRTCRDDHLSVAASQLGIDGRKDQSYFADEIGVDDGCRENSVVEATVADAQTISHRVYLA